MQEKAYFPEKESDLEEIAALVEEELFSSSHVVNHVILVIL